MNDAHNLYQEFGPSHAEEHLEQWSAEIGSETTITLETKFSARCPIDGEKDEYVLTVEYVPGGGSVLEIESFDAWLDCFVRTPAPQEAWCVFLHKTLKEYMNPAALRVTIQGKHGGVVTEVERANGA